MRLNLFGTSGDLSLHLTHPARPHLPRVLQSADGIVGLLSCTACGLSLISLALVFDTCRSWLLKQSAQQHCHGKCKAGTMWLFHSFTLPDGSMPTMQAWAVSMSLHEPFADPLPLPFNRFRKPFQVFRHARSLLHAVPRMQVHASNISWILIANKPLIWRTTRGGLSVDYPVHHILQRCEICWGSRLMLVKS